uniref:tRNA (guanine-N(1)-)-methyltransferase n=1 Tax=Candidatus Kentrum sp. MB TaxID=2138164 RepID=A0A450WYT8_9GAMM|nr:MAG: tRNA (Guanine37-N(1)-) methyltransferase [Candidatus Kentron sp. MB]VFK32608.1 MAG: tRNA (Guanine37-N(1)-) methyltransferase [Candidatus Kentron sp. MB]VFK75996.1 MAG: tRNA (Guanine37-N(1)-) methyltransferase [Candidatus Kentron sp. MB]
MLHAGVISIFPEMFDAITRYGITRRALETGILRLDRWNPRDFADDQRRNIDDRPYGGGPGMVMRVEPLRSTIRAARKVTGEPVSVIYLSPKGRRLDHVGVRELAARRRLIFVCGRYEGVDERLIALEVDEEWSVGDYVLSGGEIAAMIIIDALTRWLPGALGHEDSATHDSFAEGLLDCPHYTRPEIIDGYRVPNVLISGNHKEIALWREKHALGRTWLKRPDLLGSLRLTREQQTLLQEFIEEYDGGSDFFRRQGA